MDCSTLGLPVHHQLPELAQTHVHRVGDAIQPSHPLVSPFSSCLQSFPASGSFQMSQFFTSGGQSTEVSASTSDLPMNIQDWFPLGWTGLIFLQSKGLSRVFSNTTISKAFILQHSAFFIVQLSHPYLTTGKTIALTRQTFIGKVMSLLFIMLSRWPIRYNQTLKWYSLPERISTSYCLKTERNSLILSENHHGLTLTYLLYLIPTRALFLHIHASWYVSSEFWFSCLLV